MKFIIVLFGAPGCGKGHLWGMLQEQLLKLVPEDELSYISTGNLIREEINKKSDLGCQIAELVQKGKLVPDSIVDNLVTNALSEKQSIKVLDGYPRTNAQFDALKAQIDDDTEVIAVFRDTPVDIILGRIAKRRVCKNCKHTHTSDDLCCPKCGGESLIRKDDAAIEARLEEFRKNTLPIWKRMSEIGISIRCIGDPASEDIAYLLMHFMFD